MADIIEVDEFAPVPLLERGDKVLGGVGGMSNKQATALASRTHFINKRLQNLLVNSISSVNGQTGEVTLGFEDLGAEERGTALRLIDELLSQEDPFPNLLSEERAKELYIKESMANKPGGFIKLDGNGNVPASILDTIASRSEVVENEQERLALTQIDSLTICVQVDVNQVFYLNGGLDPSISGNWLAGQSTDLIGVLRVFGRTGDVVAEAGDYNADQIEETATRQFVSPEEKTEWSAKQDQLESGTNIRTINNQSLLGSGDLVITAEDLGAAAKDHTHTLEEIDGLTDVISEGVNNSIKPGNGVSIHYDPVTGETIISATGVLGDPNYVVINNPNALANQAYTFPFENQFSFQLDAFALKEVKITEPLSVTIDEFNQASSSKYSSTKDVIFDGSLRSYQGQTYLLSSENGYFRTVIRANGRALSVEGSFDTFVPVLTSSVGSGGYQSFGSNSKTGSHNHWKAFNKNYAGTYDNQNMWWSDFSSVPGAWLRIECPGPTTIQGYQVRNTSNGVAGANNNGYPLSFKFWGSNSLTESTWVVLDAHVDLVWGHGGETKVFRLSQPATYRYYRLTFDKTSSTDRSVGIGNFDIMSQIPLLFKDKDGTHYTVSNGVPIAIPSLDFAQGFANSNAIDTTLFEGLEPIQLLAPKQSLSNIPIRTYYRPHPQIVLPLSLQFAGVWSDINSSVFAASQGGEGKVRTAVTRDNLEWFVWDQGNWVSIGSLTSDTSGAQKLIDQGNSPATLDVLANTEWMALFEDNQFIPDQIGFAFATDIVDPRNDVASIQSLGFQVNGASRWIKQSASDVEITWYVNGVSFTPKSVGNYKFAYQTP